MTATDLLAAAESVRATAIEREPEVAAMTLAGIGWATVEHERAIRELDELLGRDPGDADGGWPQAARDELLGAGAWTRALPGNAPMILVVLEPDTEGRLAASLARHGEGVVAAYLQSSAGEDGGRVDRSGPLGRGRLVEGGPGWGPHVIVLSRSSR